MVLTTIIGAEFAPQAHSGLFQFLPLGLRVQEKIERLLDKHMLSLGLSDCRTVHNTRVTNVPSCRCIKAFIIYNFIRRFVEEDGKARWQQFRGKFYTESRTLCGSGSNIFNK